MEQLPEVTQKRLTPAEHDRIIELRLQHMSYNRIAAEVGVSTRTAWKVYNKWLDETSEERKQYLERVQEAGIQNLLRIARDVYEVAEEARLGERWNSYAMLKAEERQAIQAVMKLAGADQPTRIEHSGSVHIDLTTMTEEELEKLIKGE